LLDAVGSINGRTTTTTQITDLQQHPLGRHPSMSSITADRLTRTFGELTAVDNLTFEMPARGSRRNCRAERRG